MKKNIFADIRGLVKENESMSLHTTFKTGGNADYFILPSDKEDLLAARYTANKNGLKVFILGGGANVLFPDEGYRGAVISTESFDKLHTDNDIICVGSGVPISSAAEFSCREGLDGLQYFYSMPGSAGGAVWMNARCYDNSISDTLYKTVYLDKQGNIVEKIMDKKEFGYKKSPFQDNGGIILEVFFKLAEGNKSELEKAMMEYKADRTSKGHFEYPCAGSVFKNNRDFGSPTGKIIDTLGLRGYTIGGAKISDHHANIIVNTGNASAADIKELAELISRKVKEVYGFSLEREIIYA